MERISIENVVRTYNGKEGCACGCLGRYSLKSASDIKAANQACGYEASDLSDVRPRAVATAVRKCNEAIEEFGDLAKPTSTGALEYSKDDVWFCRTLDFVSITRNGRNSTAYFVF
jgi:hypothetical protein